MSIGTNIRDYRKNKGMSQEDLAKALRVDRSEIVNWENDLSTPEYRDLRMLANIFNVRITDIEKARSNEPKFESKKNVSEPKIDSTFDYEEVKSFQSKFKSFVRDDEEILWEGKAAYNFNSSKENIFIIPFGIFFFIFAMFWMGSAFSMGAGVFGFFGMPFVIVGIIIAFVVPKIIANNKKNTYYAVTNKRVLRYIDTNRHTFNEIRMSSINDIGFTVNREGIGTITFNDSRNPYPHNYSRNYHMNNSFHHHGGGFNVFNSFINIPHAKKVYDIINNLLESND